MLPGVPSAVPVAAGLLEDLARQHVIRALEEILPREGSVLVASRDHALADALAAGGRAVLLATPTPALSEVATGRCASTVAVVTGIPADCGPLSSAVLVLGTHDEVEPAVKGVDGHVRPGGSIALVVPPELADAAADALSSTGRAVQSYDQVLKATSCIGGDGPVQTSSSAGSADRIAVIVLAGDARLAPGALLGHDANPDTWRSATSELVLALKQAQQAQRTLLPASEQLATARAQLLDAEQALAEVLDLRAREQHAQDQVQALAQQLATSQASAQRLEARVDDLLSSTSWRVSAPLRAVSNLFRRR